jgi:hypothetical protein
MNTVNDEPFLAFLQKTFKCSAEEFLEYSPWDTDNNLYFKEIEGLEFDLKDISIFNESHTAIEAIIKCYDSDNTILFYLLSTQIMDNNSNILPVFVYNYSIDENEELSDEVQENPYIWLSDVSVYLFRTRNIIFVFQNTRDWAQGFLINIGAKEVSETISQLFLKYITTKITTPNQLLEIAKEHYSITN